MSVIQQSDARQTHQRAVGEHSRAAALYVLLIVSMITMLNYLDRNLLSILVEDIKRDLRLSDGQLGMLSGLAFALVYSIFALPVARLADNGRRVRVLGASLILWSGMTALCGLTTGFVTLLLARFGVGAGEAGGAPTTHAIVAETFGPKHRATALSLIATSGVFGILLAYAAGGAIATHYGWRAAFIAAAIPGGILAAILLLTVREPSKIAPNPGTESITLRQAVKTLSGRRSYMLICIGLAISTLGDFAGQAWIPAFLMRHYNMTAAAVGSAYSAAVGPSMLVGVILGGVVCDWASRRDQRWPVWMLALSYTLALPLVAAFLLVHSFGYAMILAAPMTLVQALWTAPAYAVVQSLSGARLRASGAALFMLIVNVVGQAFGPLLVGSISDWLTPTFGRDSLRVALLVGTGTYLIGIACFLLAARTVCADIAQAAEQ